MAQYQINYECGHTGTVKLFGKNTERDRKIEWLSGQKCPSCARKERGIECRFVVIADKAQIQFIGDTYPHKDGLKGLGYRFSHELLKGYFDMKPETGWYKEFPIAKLADDNLLLQSEIDKITGLSLPAPVMKVSEIEAIVSMAALGAKND